MAELLLVAADRSSRRPWRPWRRSSKPGALLQFMYTNSPPQELEASMAELLLVAADRHELEELKLSCEETLCKNIDASSVVANDMKTARELVEVKLAPCHPGADDPRADLDECPICFLFYPSLNRSKCCAKGICTECFLQMKSPTSCRPTQCPYCKMLNYAVEYRGVKTKEEKGVEQIEEQRVIEAQIRMRHQELQEDAERLKNKQTAASAEAVTTAHVECCDTGGTSTPAASSVQQ